VWRQDAVVAVFNWESADREVTVSLPGRHRVRDLWQGIDLGVLEGDFALPVPASGVRLVALGEA
jgi:hypothetical protein